MANFNCYLPVIYLWEGLIKKSICRKFRFKQMIFYLKIQKREGQNRDKDSRLRWPTNIKCLSIFPIFVSTKSVEDNWLHWNYVIYDYFTIRNIKKFVLKISKRSYFEVIYIPMRYYFNMYIFIKQYNYFFDL